MDLEARARVCVCVISRETRRSMLQGPKDKSKKELRESRTLKEKILLRCILFRKTFVKGYQNSLSRKIVFQPQIVLLSLQKLHYANTRGQQVFIPSPKTVSRNQTPFR